MVFQPNDRSSYSNVGYALLGMAIAKMAGMSYEDSVAKAIITPLGMTNTGFSKPNDASGIIPVIEHTWALDMNVYKP